MKKYFKSEKGSVAIVVALAFMLLIGCAALVVDFGRMASDRRGLQNALDAASLAGAQAMIQYPTDPDATARATAAARQYAQTNGVDLSATPITVTVDATNKTVKVSATQSVGFTFARAITGANSGNVSAAATAKLTNLLGDTDYAIFSGSDTAFLKFTSSNNVINGSVRCNASISNQATVNDGNIYAVGTISGNIDIVDKTPTDSVTYQKYPNANVVPMPDFSGLTSTPGVITITSSTLDSTSGVSHNAHGYSMSADTFNNLAGLSSGYKIVYFPGVSITIDGSGFQSSCCIIADGDVTFDGSNVNMDSQKPVAICSLNGSITFNGGSGIVYGSLLAPKGTVHLNGSKCNISGAVYGNVVDNNGGFTVTYNKDALSALPDRSVFLIN